MILLTFVHDYVSNCVPVKAKQPLSSGIVFVSKLSVIYRMIHEFTKLTIRRYYERSQQNRISNLFASYLNFHLNNPTKPHSHIRNPMLLLVTVIC